MQQQYTIRFRALLENIGSTDGEKAKKLAQKSEFDFTQELIFEKSYINEECDYVWCNCVLPFIPQIGMNISGFPNDISWDQETPIVTNVHYYIKANIFMVDLDWGLHNQLELSRIIKNKIIKLTRYDP